MKHVVIYTDGACSGNPGPGGWGVLLRYAHHEKKLSGAEPETTNNRMELTAAIRALELLRERCRVDLYTDSQYLQKGITQWLVNWKKKNWKRADKTPVKNVDLWQQLDDLVTRHQISWHWVKAHNDHPENDLVDQLARDAIVELKNK